MADVWVNSAARSYGDARVDAVAMPAVPNGTSFEPNALDRIGRKLHDHWALTGIASVAGMLCGIALAPRLGVPTLLAALSGALVAPAALVGAALLTGRQPERSSHAPLPSHSPASDAAAGARRLRVMTFNIHDGMGTKSGYGSRADLAAVAETIRRENPDVVVLQEVDDQLPLTGFRDQTGDLAEQLGATGGAFVPASQRVTGRQKGNAILTFHGVTVEAARGLATGDLRGDGMWRRTVGAGAALVRGLGIDVPGTGIYGAWHPRTPLDAMVRTPEGELVRVLSVHLSGTGKGSGGSEGDSQADELGAIVPTLAAWDGPTVVAGDFNVKSQTEAGARERAMLGSAGLRDAFTTRGLAQDDPERLSFRGSTTMAIDRVYASGGMLVGSARVVRDGPASSDHYPLVADLAM